MKSNHTPTPWKSDGRKICNPNIEGFKGAYRIADCYYNDNLARCASISEAEANAELICKAVNEYAALCKVAEAASKLCNFCPTGELDKTLSELEALRK